MIPTPLSTFTVLCFLWLSSLTKAGVNGLLGHEKLIHSTLPTGSRFFFPRNGSSRWSTKEATDASFAENSVIVIKPKAIERLLELKGKQLNTKDALILRLGVRNGGCSGLSYAMDFTTEDAIDDDDVVDDYPELGIKCVVDPKSMLYLYGLELDYSDALIGGGFKFFNPNAEESCGCGSSFGV